MGGTHVRRLLQAQHAATEAHSCSKGRLLSCVADAALTYGPLQYRPGCAGRLAPCDINLACMCYIGKDL